MSELDEVEVAETVESPTTITIPDAEPANDNDGGTTEATAATDGPPTPRHTRGERKANKDNRFREALDRAEEATRRAQAESEARIRLEARLAETERRQQAWEQRQRQSEPDPTKKKIADAHETAWKKLQAAAASQDPQRSAEAMKEYHEALTAAAEVAADQRMEAQLRRFQQSLPDPQVQRTWSTLTSEFEWLESNHAARTMADGYIGYLVGKGRPNNMATYREACAMAAKQFELGGGATERPSQARRAAYGGVSGRASADDGNDRTQIQVSGDDARRMRAMAKSTYPELDADEAFKKWTQRVGPKLAR